MLKECLEYTELIARNVSFGATSLFGSSRAEKKYECNSFAGLIVGGVEAKPGEFPHMAALGVKDSNGSVKFICGGSLISEKFVLTAAHCVDDEGFVYSLTVPDKLGSPFFLSRPNIVRLGNHDFSTRTGEPSTDYEVWKVHVHDEYNLVTKKNDIALIEFESAVKLNKYVRPACLHQSKSVSGSVIAVNQLFKKTFPIFNQKSFSDWMGTK